jgi:hypothetical protein
VGRLCVAHLLEIPHDIIGGEITASMELHAFAKMKEPALIVFWAGMVVLLSALETFPDTYGQHSDAGCPMRFERIEDSCRR